MAKVLRLHGGISSAGDNIEGWGRSQVIGDAGIKSIVDPQNSSSNNEITSIPSPFARMDLIKQAFAYVNTSGSHDGNTIYHRMVSDCLDVAEIFFNYESLHNNGVVELCAWNIGNVDALKQGTQEERLLGETLSLFINADKENIYNLQKMQSIFILKYVGPGAPEFSALGEHIIGATSPCTLFFTPAGDLSYASPHILFEGNDRPFDKDFNPLYNRDKDFLRYLVWLSKFDGFSVDFPEVSQYIQDTITHCNAKDNVFGNELRSISASTQMDIDYITLSTGEQVIVNGFLPIMCKVANTDKIEDKSEFVIKATKPVSGLKPLVLPMDQSCRGLIYTKSKWDGQLADKVPVTDELPLNKRLLPGLGIAYPYLSIGDFFEGTLFKTNFSSNSFVESAESDYFSLGSFEEGLDMFLVPIKKEYFDYFTLNDLKQNLKAKKGPQGEIIVTLNIPIRGNGMNRTVVYQRIYTVNEPANPRKFGQIIDINTTGVTVFPHLRFPDNTDDYRVTLYISRRHSEELNHQDFPTLSFIKEGEHTELVPESEICRNMDSMGNILDRNTIVSKTWRLTSPFDLVEVHFDQRKNLVIPCMKSLSGPHKFSFAVDFGTTNTHIEYCSDINNNPQPLDITENDAQIRPSKDMARTANYTKVQIGDFIPLRLGKNSDVAFPIRTALTYKLSTDWGLGVVPFMQANIPFYYEKKTMPSYNEIPKTNLKWVRENKEDKARMRNFIENLAYIMRNKVLMNGGNLSDTKIIWFYPTSMSPLEVGDMEKAWNKIYEDYFKGPLTNVQSIPEAVAPLSYYRNATTNAITIDIGGGTCDFMFAQDKEVKCISSARFASNSLFGDGLNDVPMSNGIINHFLPYIEEKISKYSDLTSILETLKMSNSSVNLSSYFFSLANNATITDSQEKENLDFTSMIENSAEACSILLLFYMSLIYHSAQVLKAKGMAEPRHIGFSGNGSRVLNIFLSNSVSRECLIDITKGIFEQVLEHEYDEDGLDILQCRGDSPKEATSKGGLEILNSNNAGKYGKSFVRKHSIVLLGRTDDAVADVDGKYNSIDSISDEDIDNMEKNVRNFVEICKKVLLKEKANTCINILNPNDLFDNKAFSRDIKKYLRDGLGRVKKGEEISTTLFFYPMEGILHKLGQELFKND